MIAFCGGLLVAVRRKTLIRWKIKSPAKKQGFSNFYGVDGIRTRGLCLDRAAC